MKNAVSDVRALLKEKDLRLTPQREAILRILLDNKSKHLTAEAIYDHTRSTYPEIGLATVYRTLELFEDLGIVSGLDLGGGGRRYELSLDEDHHHVVCLDCGQIAEFNEDLLDGLQEVIACESGFLITHHSLRFFGYCSQCRRKYKKSDADER
ncbi:MAG: transcriptional repressor [Firmicutes bacterium]|nr:transcriptional repressor [Bacillota bacterium]